MNLHCIKCRKFTNNNNNTKIKREMDRKIILYSHCMNLAFKKFGTIDKED